MHKPVFLIVVFLFSVGSYLSFMHVSNNQFGRMGVMSATPPVQNVDEVMYSNIQVRPDEADRIVEILKSARLSNTELSIVRKNFETQSYGLARSLARRSKLTDLQNERLLEKDIEIRIWEMESLYSSKTKGYVFTFSGDKGSAFSLNDSGDKQFLKRIFFAEPISGWKAWREFIEKEVSPERVKTYAQPPAGTDGLTVVIEVKFGTDYSKNVLFDSSADPVVLRIYQMIKKEFLNTGTSPI